MMTEDPLFLDVRPLLAAGEQPMAAILDAVDRLASGQALRLCAPFRPDPLLRMLEKRGFTATVEHQEEGDCRVLFSPPALAPAAPGEDAAAPSPLVWPEPERHLDLTDRAPAEAMDRALAALDPMAEGSVLFALFTGEPEALYSALTRRGHRWVGNFDRSGETYRMLIRRGRAAA